MGTALVSGCVNSSAGYCCSDGQCRPSLAACTGAGFPAVNDEPPAQLLGNSVDDQYAEYARTLCRVLNHCGDGDEALCGDVGAMSDQQLEDCVLLGCCSVVDIPEERRK